MGEVNFRKYCPLKCSFAILLSAGDNRPISKSSCIDRVTKIDFGALDARMQHSSANDGTRQDGLAGGGGDEDQANWCNIIANPGQCSNIFRILAER